MVRARSLTVHQEWEEIQKAIRSCVDCRRHGFTEVLCNPPNKTPTFPPSNISILFISEAPPRSGQYFYDEIQPDGLRTRIFRVLASLDFQIHSIKDLVSNHFYLVPTVKCPSQKNGQNRKPRNRVINLCINQHLKREIQLIKPNAICLLGQTALYGFSKLYPKIKFNRLYRCHGNTEPVKVDGKPTKVLISYWPRERTRGLQTLTQDLTKLLPKR